FNTSLAWRPPSVNELYVNGLHHGTANFEIGNPNLRSERAWNFSTQFKYNRDSSFSADITVYSNYIQNFINLVPVLPPTLTFRGAYPTFQFIQTNALLSGSDIRVSKNFGNYFNVNARVSLLLPYDVNAATWLQQMPAQRVDADIIWYFKSDHPKQSSISLNVAWVGRQNLVPEDSKDYLPPPDAYILTNIEYATLLHIKKNHLNFAVSIYNLFNTRYRDYMNRFRYFNDEAGRNIVVRLKIPFKS
ncbi:MAG: TonB-dependent receptor domain-containing protein, partial [Bacteroidota bacterium]